MYQNFFALVTCLFVLVATIAIIIVAAILYKKHFPYRFRRRKSIDEDNELMNLNKKINFLERRMIDNHIETHAFMLHGMDPDSITYNEIKGKMEYLQEQLNESRD